MEGTTFLIIVWDNLNALLAAGYRRYGGGREITWFAVPNTASEPAVPLSTILNGAEMASQGWFSEDNSIHQLHDGSLDSFAAWAAEQFGARW